MFSCEGKLTVFGQAGPFSFTYYRFFFACDLDGICIYGSLSFVPGIREWYRGHASYWIILNDSLRGIKNSGDLAFKINDLVNAGRRLWLVWVWAEGEGLDRNRY